MMKQTFKCLKKLAPTKLSDSIKIREVEGRVTRSITNHALDLPKAESELGKSLQVPCTQDME